jgi:hypothetical protein
MSAPLPRPLPPISLSIGLVVEARVRPPSPALPPRSGGRESGGWGAVVSASCFERCSQVITASASRVPAIRVTADVRVATAPAGHVRGAKPLMDEPETGACHAPDSLLPLCGGKGRGWGPARGKRPRMAAEPPEVAPPSQPRCALADARNREQCSAQFREECRSEQLHPLLVSTFVWRTHGRSERDQALPRRPSDRDSCTASEAHAGSAPVSFAYAVRSSGERGIRTLGTLASTHDFQSCTFGHSVISPDPRSLGPRRARRLARDANVVLRSRRGYARAPWRS